MKNKPKETGLTPLEEPSKSRRLPKGNLSRTGFTFVELILAASIFAIVAVAIYSTFGTGISAWKKTQKAQNVYQDIRLALDKMAQDLESAVLYKDEPDFSNFAGMNNQVSFYTLVDVFREMPIHPELRKITYSLDGNTLRRLEQTFAESVQEEQTQESEEIAGQISKLNFFYYYEVADDEPWMEAWDSAQSIPRGVKIDLELNGEAEENLAFTKYVFIPQGEKGQQ